MFFAVWVFNFSFFFEVNAFKILKENEMRNNGKGIVSCILKFDTYFYSFLILLYDYLIICSTFSISNFSKIMPKLNNSILWVSWHCYTFLTKAFQHYLLFCGKLLQSAVWMADIKRNERHEPVRKHIHSSLCLQTLQISCSPSIVPTL